LDKEAARFARALQSHLEYGSDQEYLFSGHDIERWLFKVAMGLYSGKILIVSFDGRFLKSRAFLDCIINPVIGNRAGGLYISDIEERVVLDYEEFVVAPVTFPKTQNFSVIKYYFFGIPFTLIFHGDSWLEQAVNDRKSVFRPRVLILKGKHRTTGIWLSWHGEAVGKGVQLG
jgi:hypothetical protein